MTDLIVYLMVVGVWVAGGVVGWMVRDLQRDKREAASCHLQEIDAAVITQPFEAGHFVEFMRRARDEWSDTVRPARDEAALELLRTDPEGFFRRTRRQLP